MNKTIDLGARLEVSHGLSKTVTTVANVLSGEIDRELKICSDE